MSISAIMYTVPLVAYCDIDIRKKESTNVSVHINVGAMKQALIAIMESQISS